MLIVAFVFRIVVFFGTADGSDGGGGRVHDDYHSTNCINNTRCKLYIETEQSVLAEIGIRTKCNYLSKTIPFHYT